MTKKIADIRRDYTMATLDVATVNTDPVKQFEKWFAEALDAGVIEPNAMTLATVNSDGRPSARIVLLKGVEHGKFIFYSNYQSKKGKELDENPACAITFFWPDVERQVRIEGMAERVDEKVAEAYFQSRPRGSQVGAWASPQSAMINDRMILDERVSQIEKRFDGQPVLPKPHQWGGFQIEPTLVEFWQGRANRLHDRIEYVKSEGAWKIHRLAP